MANYKNNRLTLVGDLHGKLPQCGTKLAALDKASLGTTIAL